MGLLNFDDPDSAGMMGIAQGLLSASGPSRMPVSLGQAFSQGSQMGQKAYQDAMNDKRMQLAYQLQMMQLQQQLRQQALLDPIYQEISKQFNGGVPAVATSAPATPGLSPSSAAAFGRPDMATPDVPAPQPAQPSGTIMGVPRNVMAMAALKGPAGLADAAIKFNEPTEFQRDLNLLPPDMRAAAISQKLTPPVVGRGDGLFVADGKGGMKLVPGYLEGATALEEAKQGVKNKTTLGPARQNASGQQITETMQQAIDRATGGYSPSGASPSPMDKAAIAAWKTNSPNGEPFTMTVDNAPSNVSGPTLTQQAEQEGRGKTLNDQYSDIQKNANTAAESNAKLRELQGYLQNFKPGKTAPIKQWLAEWSNGIGIPLDPKTLEAANSMEAFNKIALGLATQASKQLSSRPSQLEFEQMVKANPNIALLPEGLQKVMLYNMWQNQQAIKKQGEADQWINSHNNSLQGFESDWNTRHAMPQTPSNFPMPSPKAISTLKLNPKLAEEFDARFGEGASQRYLGSK